MKVAVITDGPTVPRFILEAIDRIQDCGEITVYACSNTIHKRRPWKHGAYYALNLLSVRNSQSRAVPVAAGLKRITRTVEFASDYEGAWQRLPEPVLADLGASGFDVILKVGMGLLRVPPADVLAAPILSFHHGDPDCYCGRPAGFWEMRHGAPMVGQIVQRLSNKVDGGAVLAFAETRIHRHSYRATLVEAYRHSPLLINEAIRNAVAGRAIDKASNGKNYRLPSNGTVLRFVFRMAGQFLRRLAYGAFVEKGWKVSLTDGEEPVLARLTGEAAFPPPERWRTLEPDRRHLFYADPFFSEDPPGLLVEALNRSNALGEIVLVEGEQARQVSRSDEHFSYPCTLRIDGAQIIVPETAVSSAPMAYTLRDGAMVPLHPLSIDVEDGLIDPTLHIEDGRIYLFANRLSIGPNALFLWSAPSLDGRFELHPLAPVRISPLGARMAGSLLRVGGRMIRLGQDFTGDYGDGLVAFEVEDLSPASYRERKIGALRFADRSGPHTMNVRGAELVFDWYTSRITPLAGLRRLLAHRKAAAAQRAEPRLAE